MPTLTLEIAIVLNRMMHLPLLFLFLLNANPMFTVDCTHLQYDDEDRAFLNRPEELFTGKCECYYSNGNKMLENNYKNGELDGKSYIWFVDGRIQLESQYESGRRIGLFKTFYPSGNKQSEVLYDTSKPEKMITLTKWKENGEVEMKIEH